MELRKASRKKSKIRMGLQGPSGSGKSYSSLLIAYGLCKDWSKIAVIDTESNSADLYSHLGPFNVLNLSQPFTPEKYIDAIRLCEKSMEVVIIDSVSHEWEGIGGVLSIHAGMSGNSFTNWGKLTPRHNAFIQSILQSGCHVIATIRSKQDYVLNEKNGKLIPEKVGLKGVTRKGLDFELTIVLNLDMKNNASCTKDRTGLFFNETEFKPTIETGKKILAWCNEGLDADKEIKEMLAKIQSAVSVDELISLFKITPYQDQLLGDFSKRRHQLEASLVNVKSSKNGTAK
ncbi:MAG: AAA family ATPase [Chitinophagaceae bacterium]|nr:AAA family ATPase [Chitinophagaceae bacterium]